VDHSLDRFLKHIQYEKRYSIHTLTAYREDNKQFLAYLNDQFQVQELAQVSHSFIRSWVVSLMDSGMKASAVNRKISSLRSFFRFLMREKVIINNPMLKVVAPKKAKRLPVFVEQSNMDLLFKHVMTGGGFQEMRDRMILELFYATGMRLSELIGLKVNDLDGYNKSVKVLGKRNKERIIPVIPAMMIPVKEYLKERILFLSESGKSSDYFFINDKGEKMTPKTVYLTVKKYLSKVTTLDKKSPHVLRHTFATHLLNNGADINAIKEILGHSSLAATQVYTHNTIEKLKKAHLQAHPRA